MAKFKGDGRVCDVMGQVKAEFINGEIVTEDEDIIRFLMAKGYSPEAAAPVAKKGVSNGI
jgi:hypothetical protein